MNNPYFFSLHSIKPQKFDGGYIVNVTSSEVSGFENISFSGLKLNRGAIQVPIWHPNANKIGCCLEGGALVSIRTPSGLERFTVEAGDVFFVPMGYVHEITNIDASETVIKFAYNHTKPEIMALTGAIRSLSENVFTATFNTAAGFVDGLKKSQKEELIVLPSMIERPPHAISSRYKFNIADSSKSVLSKGGYLQLATKTNLPVLEGLGILGFGLNPRGVVEPHWHTNAGELVYIVKGQTRITLLSPDGKTQVLNVSGGEGAFAPASHFHNIENMGSDSAEVLAFFSHAEPDYIGIAEVMGSISTPTLASLFNVSPSYFDSFRKISEPLVIVPV